MQVYKELFTEILVFKTSISTDKEVEKVKLILAMQNITKWNIDLEDIDHVLRIEHDHLLPCSVIQLLRDSGFECEELPD